MRCTLQEIRRFLRWYESNTSDVANFAPLLLLPVQIAKKMQGRRAIYSIKAAAETPEINLSLRELLLRDSPDASRNMPDFDDEGRSQEGWSTTPAVTAQSRLFIIPGGTLINRRMISPRMTASRFRQLQLAAEERELTGEASSLVSRQSDAVDEMREKFRFLRSLHWRS
jgi:hypothetical protein